MEDERYEGWKNRESWAANLWMENTQEIYQYVLKEVTKRLAVQGVTRDKTLAIEGFFQSFFTDLKTAVDSKRAKPSTMYALIDIGSVWRIDYRELAEYWVDKITFI